MTVFSEHTHAAFIKCFHWEGVITLERRLFERVLRNVRNSLVIQREAESSHELHFLLKEDC